MVSKANEKIFDIIGNIRSIMLHPFNFHSTTYSDYLLQATIHHTTLPLKNGHFRSRENIYTKIIHHNTVVFASPHLVSGVVQ